MRTRNRLIDGGSRSLREFTVFSSQLWEAPPEAELRRQRDEREDFEIEWEQLDEPTGAVFRGQPKHWDRVSPLKVRWAPDRHGWVTANIHHAKPDWYTYVIFAASMQMAYWLAGHAVMATDRHSRGIRRIYCLPRGVFIVAPYFTNGTAE